MVEPGRGLHEPLTRRQAVQLTTENIIMYTIAAPLQATHMHMQPSALVSPRTDCKVVPQPSTHHT